MKSIIFLTIVWIISTTDSFQSKSDNGESITEYLTSHPQTDVNVNILRVVKSPTDRILYLGNDDDGKLVYSEKVQYNAFPLLVREKYFAYSDQHNRVIKGITLADHTNTQATVEATAGGIGSTFVTLVLTSERGHGLDFTVNIFA